MRTVILFIFVVSVHSGAEVLWEWDMTQLPAGWTANSFWDFDGNGAHSFVASSGLHGNQRGTQQSEMLSDTLTVPAGTEYLFVGLETDWDYDGWWATGESSCHLWLTVEKLNGEWWTVVFDSHYWGFDAPLSIHDDATSVMVPLVTGDEFYLKFDSEAWSIYSAYAEMAWDLSDLVITDQNGTALDRTTWGCVKSLF